MCMHMHTYICICAFTHADTHARIYKHIHEVAEIVKTTSH
jgi:hypothetical protein